MPALQKPSVLPAPPLPKWLESLLPFQRYRLEVRGWAMHVMEQGPEDGLPVLLLHGNPTWGFLWRRVAQELGGEARLRLIMPDLVGLGLSEHPRDPSIHTLDFHVRQVVALTEALGLTRLVVVGQDWGGPIAGCVGAELGAKVVGAVILNTALGPPKAGSRPTAFHRFSAMPLISTLVFRGALFPARGITLAQADRHSITGDVARAYRWVLRDRFTNGAPLAMARMVPANLDHPSVPRMRQCEAWAAGFKGPVAIVWGDRDPILGRLRKRVCGLLPNAEVTDTHAGHFLQEEVPKEIADAIRSVAARVRS